MIVFACPGQGSRGSSWLVRGAAWSPAVPHVCVWSPGMSAHAAGLMDKLGLHRHAEVNMCSCFGYTVYSVRLSFSLQRLWVRHARDGRGNRIDSSKSRRHKRAGKTQSGRAPTAKLTDCSYSVLLCVFGTGGLRLDWSARDQRRRPLTTLQCVRNHPRSSPDTTPMQPTPVRPQPLPHLARPLARATCPRRRYVVS